MHGVGLDQVAGGLQQPSAPGCASYRELLIRASYVDADKCAVASHQVDPGSVHLLRKLPASLYELHLTGKPDAWCAFQMPMHCSLQY